MRDTFIRTTGALLDDDPRTAVVIADISAAQFAAVARAHPDRFINVGIREQLMVSVAGGLALTGLRPYVHSYAPFLVDRAYEQIKLDLDHQGVGAVLVSIGASYDASEEGRTHQSPGDVALIDSLDGAWTVHVPGHPDEVPRLLRAAAGETAVTGDAVLLVEPYLAGTSARVVADALADRPHRLLSLGVTRTDLRRYGTPADHQRWHGLDPVALRQKLTEFAGPRL